MSTQRAVVVTVAAAVLVVAAFLVIERLRARGLHTEIREYLDKRESFNEWLREQGKEDAG